MANFDIAVEKVLELEGGYVNDLTDHGGETNFGISKRAFPALNIRDLTREDAKAIYREVYWQFEGVEDQDIANKLLDMTANLGLSQAVRLLQSILHVNIDGIFGPKTLRAANLAGHSILQDLRVEQLVYYMLVISRRSSSVKFARGWARRALA